MTMIQKTNMLKGLLLVSVIQIDSSKIVSIIPVSVYFY